MRSSLRLWCVIGVSLLGLFIAATPSQAAYEAYMKITGTKQGQFKGEAMQVRAQGNWIPVVKFDMGVQSPQDAASGQASGKRQHQPIKIVKEWGASSPQLMRAMTTNEVLPEVDVEFVRTGPGSQEQVYRTLRLSNARISAIRKTGTAGGRELEEITLVFEKMTMTGGGVESRPTGIRQVPRVR